MFIKWGTADKSGFKLPINPESYSVNGKQQNTAVNIHASGEINLKGKRALKTVSWSGFFPNQQYSFAKDTLKDPVTFYVTNLVNLLENNTTIHLIIGTRVNLFGTVESFTWGENEQNGDVVYDISIKEQRTLDKTKDAVDNASSKKYKWKKKDTWKKVTKKILGSNKTWKTQRKNNIKVINKAKKAYKKKHKKIKKVKENVALIGYTVVIKL